MGKRLDCLAREPPSGAQLGGTAWSPKRKAPTRAQGANEGRAFLGGCSNTRSGGYSTWSVRTERELPKGLNSISHTEEQTQGLSGAQAGQLVTGSGALLGEVAEPTHGEEHAVLQHGVEPAHQIGVVIE